MSRRPSGAAALPGAVRRGVPFFAALLVLLGAPIRAGGREETPRPASLLLLDPSIAVRSGTSTLHAAVVAGGLESSLPGRPGARGAMDGPWPDGLPGGARRGGHRQGRALRRLLRAGPRPEGGALYAVSTRRYIRGGPIGRISMPVTGEELTRIAVGGDAGPGSGGEVILVELSAVDSARVRDDGDEGWTTVESHRARLPEPRC